MLICRCWDLNPGQLNPTMEKMLSIRIPAWKKFCSLINEENRKIAEEKEKVGKLS